MYLYRAGKSDAYVGTQYEYGVLSKELPSLRPIMMFDRSYGGDIIMSNSSIKELQNETGSIDAYLEMDSINNTLIKDFINKHELQNKDINYINKDQTQISLLDIKNMDKKIIIVTYVPYNKELEENGFKEIASTKDGLDLFVVDAMFTKKQVLNEHNKQFIELKKLVDRGIDILKSDPKGIYDVIKPYMLNMKYDEFRNSLKDIIWINKELPQELKSRMRQSNISTRDLI
jgi:NitT/TauT family transport system substrate-binding protein